MAAEPVAPLLRHVRRLVAAQFAAALPDEQLLQRFALQGDQAAFEALVRRHGPLVLAACRRVLHDWHAAEDAFQSTFLVLARKAGALKRPGTLGPWLYGVACRTALKARAAEARRRLVERQAAVGSEAVPADDLAWRDLRPVLDEAVAGLPEASRVPFVLHHLQGLTVAEVARRLGCPQGTVAARLSRAKERLRTRLAGRGVTLSAAALAAAWAADPASACVPVGLTTRVVEAVAGVVAGKAVGLVAALAALTKGVVQAMTMSKWKVAALLLAVGTLGVGVGVSLSPQRTPGQGGPGASKGEAGVRTAESPATATPAIGERHDAGGFRSLRGFEFRGIGPTSDNGFKVGGDFMFLNSVEYQVPILASDSFYAVAFVVSGTTESRVEIKDDRVSAGHGLRLVVPQLGPAPIALDFGFPIVRARDEREQVFSYWIGLFS